MPLLKTPSPRLRNRLAAALVTWLMLLFGLVLLSPPTLPPGPTVGDDLLAVTIPESGAANAVTAVVVSFRGFDTLGEVTVLFLAATAIGMLFAGGARAATPIAPPAPPPNEIMTTGVRLLFPLLLLFGIYVIVHGHLSPGGGFQGGVIIATAVLLRLLGDRRATLPHGLLALLEGLSGSGFVLFGLAGLVLLGTGTFLGNFLPHPAAAIGLLVSAGVIPLIYILVGIKVGAEVSAIFAELLDRAPAED